MAISICKDSSNKSTSPISLQFFPSPEYPGLHEQLYDHLVLLHTASALQLCCPLAHSSISDKERKFRSLERYGANISIETIGRHFLPSIGKLYNAPCRFTKKKTSLWYPPTKPLFLASVIWRSTSSCKLSSFESTVLWLLEIVARDIYLHYKSCP